MGSYFCKVDRHSSGSRNTEERFRDPLPTFHRLDKVGGSTFSLLLWCVSHRHFCYTFFFPQKKNPSPATAKVGPTPFSPTVGVSHLMPSVFRRPPPPPFLFPLLPSRLLTRVVFPNVARASIASPPPGKTSTRPTPPPVDPGPPPRTESPLLIPILA